MIIELWRRYVAWRGQNMMYSPNLVQRYQGGWGAIIGAVVGAVGSSMSADEASASAEDAASKSAASARDAAQLQGKIYDQNREDQSAWRYGGENALNRLLQGMGIDTKYSYTGQETRDQIYKRLLGEYTKSESTGAPNVNADGQAITGGFFANMGENSRSVDVTDYARLNAAVDAEYAKQQSTGNLIQPRGADFGKLAQDFTMADYQADPGLAFRQQQGEQGLTRAAAASGRLGSGRYLKDAMSFNSGLASQEYGKAYNRFQSNQQNLVNRLQSLAGLGQTANNSLSQSGQNYANQMGNITMTNGANQANAALVGGNARASGYAGMGNALSNVNWGNFGSGSSGSSPGITYNGTNGAQDFTNGWNAENYG